MESRGFFVAKASRVGHSDTSGDLTVSSLSLRLCCRVTPAFRSQLWYTLYISIHLHTFHDAQQEVIWSNMKQHEATLILTHLGGILVSCSGTHWPGLLVHDISIHLVSLSQTSGQHDSKSLLACRKLDWSRCTRGWQPYKQHYTNRGVEWCWVGALRLLRIIEYSATELRTCCQNNLSRFLYRWHQITTVEDVEGSPFENIWSFWSLGKRGFVTWYLLGLFSAVQELPTGKTGGAMQKKTGVPWQRFVKICSKGNRFQIQTFEPTLWIAQSTSERFLTPTFGHSLAGCKMQTEAVRSLPPALLTTASCRVFKKLSLCFASGCEQIRLESS